MNTALFYGIVLALANIVLSLAAFFLGFQTDRIAEAYWFNILGLVVFVAVLWFGIRAAREEAQDGSLSYGRGVMTGFLISLYSSLIGAVYTFIHFTFINPNFVEYQLDATRQKWIAAGLGDAQIAAAEKFARFFLSPVMMSVVALVLPVLFGVILALILSAFLKRGPKTDGGAPPAADPTSAPPIGQSAGQ